MSVLVIIFAALIVLAGLILLVKPDLIFGFLSQHKAKPYTFNAAIGVRVVVGLLLVLLAADSKYPVAIQLFGWLFIISAVGLLVLGRSKFVSLISWVLKSFKPYARIAGIVAVLFGAFVIHAFV